MNNIKNNLLTHTWHPCMQMKSFEKNPPLQIKSACGPWLYLQDGRKIFDAISSWWCKSLGHNHPQIKAAIAKQMDQFEHVIFANTSYKTIELLSEKLTNLMPNFNKVFFTGDGACSIEVALKMSLQAMQIKGKSNKNQFLSLENSYHGDTAGAISISDVGKFKQPFEKLTFKTHTLKNLPYITGTNDPLWHNIEHLWPNYLAQLEPLKENLAAIIIEPVVQGAGGIKIYSPDLIKRLSLWCKKNDIYLIADEIMTGIGRTGTMSACEHANIEPDFACYSKGLTSGWMAFSACVTTDEVYNLFYSDNIEKAFLHSHTYSGNALAASAALETLKIMYNLNICKHVTQNINPILQATLDKLNPKFFYNTRSIGAIAAFDIKPQYQKILSQITQKLAQKKLGVLIRPINNTIYWMPPLNSSINELNSMLKVCNNMFIAQTSDYYCFS